MFEDRVEKLHNNEKIVINVSFLDIRKALTAGCEADEVSSTRLGLIKFRGCQDLLCGKNFLCESREVYTIAM